MAASNRTVNAVLKDAFAGKHVDAAVKHFQDAVEDFQLSEWDDASAKGGKFIEAVLKALWIFVGETVPAGKDFKAGTIIDRLQSLPKGGHPDTIKLTIPRACRFAYEVASNRGARHDADEIDPSEMDARTVVALCAWILSEMIRFSQKGHDLKEPAEIVAGLMSRRYPFAENIDGRVYSGVGKSGPDVAMVVLHSIYPARMSRGDLVETLIRHTFRRANAETAVKRIARYVDDDGSGMLRLRNSGLEKIENILAKYKVSV
jgi:hypothetical protein